MSDTTLALMCKNMIATRSKSLTAQKMSATAEDSNKPWDGNTSQGVASSVVIKGVFLPAQGHGLGRAILKPELTENAEEIIIASPDSTNADLRTFHAILDGSVQKRITGVAIIQPADQVIVYAIAVSK